MQSIKWDFTLLLFLVAQVVAAQCDSIYVYFYGEGTKGEKFQVSYKGETILHFRSPRGFMFAFTIPKEKDWKDGSQIQISLSRKGRFSLFYQSIDINPFFSIVADREGQCYYTIIRDTRLKNKYAVSLHWLSRPTSLINCSYTRTYLPKVKVYFQTDKFNCRRYMAGTD
jgi:hypothetical protein